MIPKHLKHSMMKRVLFLFSAFLALSLTTACGQGAEESTNVIEGAGIRLPLPEAWKVEPPGSSMRLGQASIPGDDGEAVLAVFFFGVGSGGGVQANIDRWVGQMETADGAEPEQETLEGDNTMITWVDVSGTLMPSMMGGATEPLPNYRMFGAVIEGEGGPWFVKVTGPEGTLAEARDDFVAMLKNAKVVGE